jgi:predicted transcriptional regulator
MHIILLFLLISGLLCLGAYFLWHHEEYNKIDTNMKEVLMKKEQDKRRIITEIYKNAGRKRDKTGSEMEKLELITKLNIFPKQMNEYIEELVKSRLVIHTKDSVSLTTFGVDYYEVFIKEKMKVE